MKIKKDWWLVNGIVYIVTGFITIFSKANVGLLQAGLFIGGINVVVGIALLQRSKIAFWIVLVLSAAGLLSSLSILSKQPDNYLPMLVNGITFAFALMLWQQIKKEGKKK